MARQDEASACCISRAAAVSSHSSLFVSWAAASETRQARFTQRTPSLTHKHKHKRKYAHLQVVKAEDPDEDLKRWWQVREGDGEEQHTADSSQHTQPREPARMLLGQRQQQEQQQEQQDAANTEADSASLPVKSKQPGEPVLRLHADGRPGSAANASRLELLFDVGMAAQAALSRCLWEFCIMVASLSMSTRMNATRSTGQTHCSPKEHSNAPQ